MDKFKETNRHWKLFLENIINVLCCEKKEGSCVKLKGALCHWQLKVISHWTLLYELPHDKTNKTACAPNENSDQPGRISLHCVLSG